MNGSGNKPLPDGWRWVRLGDYITKIGSGLTPLGGNAVYLQSGIPLIRSQNVQLNHFDVDGLVYISKEQDAEMENSRVSPGDVLLNITGASIGRVCVVPQEICPANVNQHVCIIRCQQEIHPEFLAYYISTPEFQDFIMDTQAGATRQALTKVLIEKFQIPLPPLSKQKRIAAILNEQMEAVQRARAAAEAQLKAAKALPAAYLRAVFNSPEAQAWPRKRLGEVCRDTSDGTHFTPAYVSGGVPFLSVKDIRATGISFDNCRYITEEQHQTFIRRCKPERGDVLYTKVGTTGIAKAIDTDREFSIFVSVALLKVGPQVIPEYLEKVLNSPIGRTQAANLTQGMANRNLVLQDLKQIEIPVPPLTEQKRIVSILSEQMAAAERTCKVLEDQLDTINKLPAALLRRAFSGEL